MIIIEIIRLGVTLSIFEIIYSHVDQVAGWTKAQTYFFTGFLFTNNAIFTTLFSRNFWNFSYLVNRGDLDSLLIKPVHPLFLALLSKVNITMLLNAIFGFWIMKTYAEASGFIGGWRWLEVIGWLIFGSVLQTLLRFFFSVWVFWTERSNSISRLYFKLYELASKPDSFYPSTLRFTITLIIPLALISAVPTRALLFGLTLTEQIQMGLVLLALMYIDKKLWNKGLQRYQSASS
tara:strand:+ start:3551 stop:4252 length:702 start_codon:yes stop_codon:yes gene_type:complete